VSKRSNGDSNGGSRRAVPNGSEHEAARSSRMKRPVRPHPVDRMREINALPDPDPFSGRPPIESIEIRQKTYHTAKVQPLDVTGVRTLGVGVVLWLVAFIALLPFYSTLQDDGRGAWLWTCLAGFGLGLLGLQYCRRRRNRLEDDPEEHVETSPLGAAGL
jgi:Protein of unknown function (DUF2530)